MTKKIYVDVFVFLPSTHLHIYRWHLSPKLCPIPDIPLMGENIIIFSNKTFQVIRFEKYTLLNLV